MSISACSPNSAVVPAVRSFASSASPCDITGFWYFHGACKTFYVDGKGKTLRLRHYRGMSLTLALLPNVPVKSSQFVAGIGTSDTDITGTYHGASFPLYGSIDCVDLDNTKTACVGKAFLYMFMDNASPRPVGFNADPGFTIVSKSGYPGTRCQLNSLTVTSSGQLAWVRFPILGRVVHQSVKFKPWTAALLLRPDYKAVFAFSCGR